MKKNNRTLSLADQFYSKSIANLSPADKLINKYAEDEYAEDEYAEGVEIIRNTFEEYCNFVLYEIVDWFDKKYDRGEIKHEDMKGVLIWKGNDYNNFPNLDPRVIPDIKKDYELGASDETAAINILDDLGESLDYSAERKDPIEYQRYYENGSGQEEDENNSNDNLNIAVAKLNNLADKFLNKYANKKKDLEEGYEDHVNVNLKYDHTSQLRKKYLSDDAIALLEAGKPIDEKHTEFKSLIDYTRALDLDAAIDIDDRSKEFDKLKKVIGDYEVDRIILDSEALDYYYSDDYDNNIGTSNQNNNPNKHHSLNDDVAEEFVGKSIGVVNFYLLDDSNKRLTDQHVVTIIDPPSENYNKSVGFSDNSWVDVIRANQSGNVSYACFSYHPYESYAFTHKGLSPNDLKINKVPVKSFYVEQGELLRVRAEYSPIEKIADAQPSDVDVTLEIINTQNTTASVNNLANKFLNKYGK